MPDTVTIPKLLDIYCRVEEQEQACREYAEEHGFTIALVHKEIAPGDVYQEREKLNHLRQRYRDGEIQGVLVSSFDRLSQKQVHLAILFEEIEQYGVTLNIVRENVDTTVAGKLTRTFLSFLAEYESEKILEGRRHLYSRRRKAGRETMQEESSTL